MANEADNLATWQRLLAQTEWLGRLAARLVPAAEREDLVQEVLLSAMSREGEPRSARGWLATVARNLVARRRRREHNRRARELSLARSEASVPPAAEAVETFATHRAVVNAVMDLEEPYRTAVLLRFWEDLPPREVARRTGVPVETARTRVKRGVDKLRAVLDQRGGGRTAWAAPLLQIGAVQKALAEVAAVPTTTAPAQILTGALAMKKAALATVAAAFVLATVAVFTLGRDESRAANPSRSDAEQIARIDHAPPPAPFGQSDIGNARAETGTRARSGSLLARVCRPDGAPVRDVRVYLRAVERQDLGVELRTDPNGEVVFTELAPGGYRVLLDRDIERTVRVPAGLRAKCVFEVGDGLTVRGHVVTLEKHPVPGARVYAFQEEHHDLMMFLTGTDDAGAFVLHDVAPGLELLARADGWQPTGRRHSRTVQGAPGDTVEVEIELGARGHALCGSVLDPLGRPAPRAWVGIAVDEDSRKWIDGMQELREHDGNEMLDRETFFVRTDEEGRFVTTEVPWGDTVVMARGAGAQDHLVGAARVRVDKGASNAVVVHLRAGGTVFGTVRDEEGEPYGGITLLSEFRGTELIGELERGFGHHLADRTCVTAADGGYRIDGLFEAEHGMSRLLPTDETHIRRFEILAGQELRLDLTVPRTWQLRVKVQDPPGNPLEGWAVMLSGSGSIPYRLVDKVLTDADGVYVATGLRAERYVLSVHAPDQKGDRPVRRFPSFLRFVTRAEDEVVVTATPPTAALSGRVLDPTGAPVDGARVSHVLTGFEENEWTTTDRQGRFHIPRLPAGDYRLQAFARGFPAVSSNVSLADGQSRELGDIVFPDPAFLEVEVLADDGSDIEHARVWLSSPARSHEGDARGWKNDWGSVTELRRRQGNRLWRSDPVVADDYLLHVEGREAAPVVREVRLMPGKSQRMDVTCPRGVVQDFEICLCDPIHLERGNAYGWLAFEDRHGRHVLNHRFDGPLPDPGQLLMRTSVRLLSGSYRVLARGRTGTADLPITVPEGGGPPIRIALR